MRLFTISIALMPILNNYQSLIKGIGVGEIIVLLSMIGLIINKRTIKLRLEHSGLLLFFIYALIISALMVAFHSSFSARDVIVRMTFFAFYTAIICIPTDDDFDTNIFIKYYLRICDICCIFLFVQIIVFHILHRIILGVLPGVPLNYAISNYSMLYSRFNSLYSYFYRPTSLFLEPAHFAQFMGPAIPIVLLKKDIKFRLFRAIAFSASVLLSTSSVGIVIVGFSWISYFIYTNKETMNVKKMIQTILIIAVIIATLFFVANISETFSYGLTRLEKILSGGNSSGSSYERISKGFEIWNQLKFHEKIFGIGYGTYDSYYSMGTINVYDGEVEYMNSLSYILVSGGIISLLLFFFALSKYFNRRNALNLTLILLLLILFLSSSVINTPIYAIIMILLSRDNQLIEVN